MMRITLIAAAVALASPWAHGGDCVREIDRVLMMSTRPVGCSTDAARLASDSYAAELIDGRWDKSPAPDALGSLDPAVPVVFYIHGNQEDSDDARRRGLDVYRRLVRCAAEHEPVQFVLFSWSSEKVPGLLRDPREKAARTRPVGWQFAWALDQVPAGARVGVMGYSYGARVASGAAHLLAGGSLGGLSYVADSGGPAAVRGVFLAAAYDACWNSPRACHGRAMDRIENLLVTVNPSDPAMKFYKWVPRVPDPPAVGGVGPTGLTGEQAARVSLLRVENSVGRSHDLYDYLAAPGLMRSAWRRLTYADAAAAEIEVASR